MVRPIDEFVVAWRSLTGDTPEDGWRSIPVRPARGCALRAGRRFPGNEEALLVGFLFAEVPAAEVLPDGTGFAVQRVGKGDDGRTWLALTRRESGSIELFSAMVSDVAGAMDAEVSRNEITLLRVFLGRVRAWQEFMRKGAHGLGPENELGLVGELCVLDSIIKAGVPPLLALEMWAGPLDAAQDFLVGMGGIEVKATLAARGFLASVGSLDQLDDSARQPLFVAGVRLARTETGRSLPDVVDALSHRLAGADGAEQIFTERLLAAGYLPAHRSLYTRRFAQAAFRVVEVTDGFPRLTAGTVPLGVLRAAYDIDLDRVPGENIEIARALTKLGVL